MIFGSMAMISAAATNFGGIVTTRWFLGMAESGFYPGVIFYLTTFYKRDELAGRLSIFYAASEVAGAFTGLIAFGVFGIEAKLKGWQYLLLIEGECFNFLTDFWQKSQTNLSHRISDGSWRHHRNHRPPQISFEGIFPERRRESSGLPQNCSQFLHR